MTKKLPTVARLLLGLTFIVFGLNFFLHFLAMPPPPAGAMALAGAMMQSGYLMQLVHAVEIVAGVLLVAGAFVPLALAVLAPVLVNIVAFHLFLAPAGLGLPLVLLVLEIYLAWAYRDAFAPMLRLHGAPHARTESRRAREIPAT
jgi:uncharacterized membrane protein YphA (DoxX/SURF4 family)